MTDPLHTPIDLRHTPPAERVAFLQDWIANGEGLLPVWRRMLAEDPHNAWFQSEIARVEAALVAERAQLARVQAAQETP